MVLFLRQEESVLSFLAYIKDVLCDGEQATGCVEKDEISLWWKSNLNCIRGGLQKKINGTPPYYW